METTDYKLGKLPAKSSRKALLFEDFIKPKAVAQVPPEYNFWAKRAKFPSRLFGNDKYGDCTRASQAAAAMHMERIETRSTPNITDDEVIRVYFEMTARLYGSGDTGAYETDALSEWRRPEYTFRDTKGRPLTIDAYTRINHLDHEALKSAIYITGGHGIKLCFNLPWAWSSTTNWTVPAGQTMIGEWVPGSWGGHSIYAYAYTKTGIWIKTWGYDQFVTWEGVAAYCDEAHWVVDSLDAWRKKPAARLVNLNQLKEAVNAVSDQKIT
jgi:hypothetical protein